MNEIVIDKIVLPAPADTFVTGFMTAYILYATLGSYIFYRYNEEVKTDLLDLLVIFLFGWAIFPFQIYVLKVKGYRIGDKDNEWQCSVKSIG